MARPGNEALLLAVQAFPMTKCGLVLEIRDQAPLVGDGAL